MTDYDPRDYMTRMDIDVNVAVLSKATRKVTVELIKVPGLVLGDLAVMNEEIAAEGISRWVILHLPSGMSFGMLGAAFSTELQAATAMEKLAKVRNTWKGITQKELSELAPFVKNISQECGGYPINTKSSPMKPVNEDDNLNARDDGF